MRFKRRFGRGRRRGSYSGHRRARIISRRRRGGRIRIGYRM